MLGKELVEQAAQRRTYIVRTVYALLLFAFALVLFSQTLASGRQGALDILGKGQPMFRTLIFLQLGGIYLFLPAMTAGVITQEKERNTLGLLLLTSLSPLTIVLEKVLSRLIPIWTLLLLSLPLAAFAYSLGGVSPGDIVGAIMFLTSASVLIAAVSIKCSTHFPNTTVALVNAYLFCPVALFLGVWIFAVIASVGSGLHHLVGQFLLLTLLLLVPAAWLIGAASSELTRAHDRDRVDYLTSLRQDLDRYAVAVREWQQQAQRGISGDIPLPGDNPIAWRATYKASLGRMRYIVLMLGVLQFWVLYFLILFVSMAERPAYAALPLIIVVDLLLLLVFTSQGANLIASERSAQTLDVLLVTPISGREILLQKAYALRRLVRYFSVLFLTISLFQFGWETGRGMTLAIDSGEVPHAALFLTSHLVYALLTAWVAVWCGLQVRNPSRAIVFALAVVFGWIFGPMFLMSENPYLSPSWLPWFNPATLILENEQREMRLIPALTNLGLHLALLLLVRSATLWRADAALGRLVPRRLRREELEGGEAGELRPRESSSAIPQPEAPA